MDASNLVCLLKELPESRLRLTELAWEAIGEDGSVDPAKVAFHAKELSEAIHEAGAYSQATKEMVLCLRELVRSQS